MLLELDEFYTTRGGYDGLPIRCSLIPLSLVETLLPPLTQ